MTIKKVSDLPQPKRILIIKPSALGDVVSALPVLRGLKRNFPKAHIAWLVNKNCSDIISHDSQIDEIIEFDRKAAGSAWKSPNNAMKMLAFLRKLREKKFDWVIDLQGLFRSGIFTFATRAKVKAGFANAREGAKYFYNHKYTPSSKHTVDRNIELARSLGINCDGNDLRLEVNGEVREFSEKLIKKFSLNPFQYLVCVIPTRWKTKNYPARHWKRVLADLSKKMPCVVLGGPDDVEMVRTVTDGFDKNVIDLTGQTSLSQMAGVIAHSCGVVCCDSAAALIAPAVGIDVVELIGPTKVERTGPYRGRAVVADIPCQGCLKRHCTHSTCMEIISPNEVISEVIKMAGF